MKTLALKILDTLLAAAQRVAEGLAKVEVTTGENRAQRGPYHYDRKYVPHK
ncbi:MAG: hypothetical protein KG075_22315 [Alphaproteobacteria bacterium]|nr:hypothetical protein [Alphaproteobacteria bacterium]